MTTPLSSTAEASDLAAIVSLLETVYVGEGYVAESTSRLTDVTAWVQRATVIVARTEPGGPIVGVVGIARGGCGSTRIAARGEMEVQRLAVAPHARRCGVGRFLVNQCVERSRAHGCARVVLWTQPTMSAAQRLYAGMGFHRQPQRDLVGPPPRLAYVLDLA